MLRVVADANVLVSAALARSPQAPSVLTLDAALDGRLELITSPHLLQEVAGGARSSPPTEVHHHRRDASVRHRPRRPDEADRRSAGPSPSRVSRPARRLPGRTRDNHRADALVTGDRDLLAIDPQQLAIEIITPRQLVDRLD
jgi:predicted nucleic acid-binding protein